MSDNRLPSKWPFMQSAGGCAAILATVIVILAASNSYAQKKSALKQSVTIVDRKESQSTYKYAVPGRTAWNCAPDIYGQTGCTGGVTEGTVLVGEYNVTGVTLSLLLPDGRLAVVNCAAKYKFWVAPSDEAKGNLGHYRDCRQPPTDNITTEFNGNEAKLLWPVSIDGSKMQNETYKVIAILSKKESQPSEPR